MHYTLHQLQIFLTIAQLKSITKASEELHLTQPAVSIQLKKFQQQFSIPLTEVVGRQLYITEFGMEIARAAEKILNEVEAINYRTQAYQGEMAGKIKVSVVSTGKYVMPYFLSGFTWEHKGVDLVMDVTNKARVIESLEANEVDFALVSVIPDDMKVNRIELMQNKLYLVGGSRLMDRAKVKPEKIFSDHPLLFREQGSATRNAMETFIRKRKLPSYKQMTLTSNEALKQAVIAGLGYSIMPIIGLKNALRQEDIRIIPFKGLPIITHWNLIWLKSKNLSPTALAFLDYLEQNKTAIIKESFDWFEAY